MFPWCFCNIPLSCSLFLETNDVYPYKVGAYKLGTYCSKHASVLYCIQVGITLVFIFNPSSFLNTSAEIFFLYMRSELPKTIGVIAIPATNGYQNIDKSCYVLKKKLEWILFLSICLFLNINLPRAKNERYFTVKGVKKKVKLILLLLLL